MVFVFMAQAEGFEPPCRLGKRFSRPPRCDHFDKPAYEILLNTWAFEVARETRFTNPLRIPHEDASSSLVSSE